MIFAYIFVGYLVSIPIILLIGKLVAYLWIDKDFGLIVTFNRRTGDVNSVLFGMYPSEVRHATDSILNLLQVPIKYILRQIFLILILLWFGFMKAITIGGYRPKKYEIKVR